MRVSRKKSVLDLVSQDVAELEPALGQEDNRVGVAFRFVADGPQRNAAPIGNKRLIRPAKVLADRTLDVGGK